MQYAQTYVILNMEVHEPSPAYNKQSVSIREYLEQEKLSIEKHEYSSIKFTLTMHEIYEGTKLV